MRDPVIAAAVFLLGLLVGSFLNVCISRVPKGESVVTGRSHCPACGAKIPIWLNIPLISYAMLRGRCKSCGVRISPVYPVVELLGGGVWLAAYLVFGLSPEAGFAALLFSVLVAVAVIDLFHQIIPDGMVVIVLVLGAGRALYGIFAAGERWYLYVIGFFAVSLPLFIISLLYEDGIGGGDIKLMAAVGLFCGWRLALLSLFAGAIFASVAAVALLLRKKATRKTPMPFGTFLAVGIFMSVLFGERLIAAYFSLF